MIGREQECWPVIGRSHRLSLDSKLQLSVFCTLPISLSLYEHAEDLQSYRITTMHCRQLGMQKIDLNLDVTS